MDITRDLKKRRGKLEHGLEKPSQDKRTQINKENKIMLENGEIIEILQDIKNLQEFDWDDPKNQEWIRELDEKNIKRYGKLSVEQMEKIYQAKLNLQKS